MIPTKLLQKFNDKRTALFVKRILPYLPQSGKILDIGSGPGAITLALRNQGFAVTPVDVASFHGPRLSEPIIYDGSHLPFADQQFETAMLLMVMHHTPDPEIVFHEAARVAKNLLIIETSFLNPFHKFITVLADTLANLQFRANWQSYRSDCEWRKLFQSKNFAVKQSEQYFDQNLGVKFLHILYYLEKN
ncbi:MAG: class I SAM-dependent methyltransferase [bacterium]